MRILVVDDNRSSANALARALGKRGDEAEALYDGAAAIERLAEVSFDVVLTDLKMEPVDGLSVLRAARQMRPPPDVIVFTAYGAIDTAVEAMQLGAHDFLTKPVTLEQIVARLDDLRAPMVPLPGEDEDEDEGTGFFAESPASRELLETLTRVAGVPSPVWLEGEIGSGRGHAAYTLHSLGRDPDAAFTTLDVARFDSWPSRGTVVLPNVDDLPDDLQRDLLRRLEHKPDGVRLVATAGPDARTQVAQGTLRPELFYQLGVIVIRVPPLRERVEDIVPMLRAALRRFGERYGRVPPDILPDQEASLRAHAWPGNIRELLNVAERAVVLGNEALQLEVVRRPSLNMPRLEQGFSLATYLEGVEKRILVEALRRANGDRTLAGKLLGVERNTLRYKLNKYDLLDR
ncbi:MAG: sigma-54-dependent Fis family transcriptional regulator [Alphaproteobacteria bacterium]|nr:sigma-54-dependent Fis family transcriptional regulator [Alphaproteobacteria bacterium]